METSTSDNDLLGKIPEIAKLVAYVLFLSILLGVVEAELYFQILLHIPIFHYLDPTEIILFSPATGITLLIYYLGVLLVFYFSKEQKLHWFPKLVTIAITVSLSGCFFYTAYHNDLVIYEMIRLPLNYWWYSIFIIIFVIAYGDFIPGVKDFTEKHKQFKPVLITFWYGLVIGFLNFYVLTESHFNNPQVNIKLKSGIKITTNDNLRLAGKTKNYWFFYNRKTKYTRIIKDEDVSFADFNSQNEY